MAKKNYKIDPMLDMLEGTTNIHEGAIKPPADQVNPYISEQYRKSGKIPFDTFKQGVSSNVPHYDQLSEDYYLTHRADRFRVKPKSWLWKVRGLGGPGLDLLTNPNLLVTDEEQRMHVEEVNARTRGFLTRWESVNGMQYPIEALEVMQSDGFRDWWFHDPDGLKVPKGPSVLTEVDGSGIPELYLHGTLATITREEGFVQLHMMDRPDYDSMDEASAHREQEIGPHFGTPGQAMDIIFGKGDGTMVDPGVLPTREQFAEAIKGQTPFAPTAKWFPGFIKMNNPLVIREDLGTWRYENILDHMNRPESLPPGTSMEVIKDEFGEEVYTPMGSILAKAGYTFSKGSDLASETNFHGIDPEFMLGDLGTGTAVSKILEYAVAIAEEEGVDLSTDEYADLGDSYEMTEEDQEQYFEDIDTLRRDIEYYRLKGMMKFLQDDLGYDGIKYWNENEDKGAPDWSIIIFNPNQFKSIYNKGTFRWSEKVTDPKTGKEKLVPYRDFMTNTNTNKYRKVS
jgi:hypothetical protein